MVQCLFEAVELDPLELVVLIVCSHWWEGGMHCSPADARYLQHLYECSVRERLMVCGRSDSSNQDD